MNAIKWLKQLQAGTSAVLPGGKPLPSAALPLRELVRLFKSSSWSEAKSWLQEKRRFSGLYCCCKSLQLRKNKLLSAEMIISWSCAGDSPRADRTAAPTLPDKTRSSAESTETSWTWTRPSWRLKHCVSPKQGTPLPWTYLSFLELKLMGAHKCPADSSSCDSAE